MASAFKQRIRRSLADANLQAALDDNAARRLQVRTAAYESLTDVESLRQRAHATRAEVIEHLEDYLTRFIDHAKENGVQVHQAADGEAAIAQVLAIASRHGAKLIAKSKTMVSEEIKLNPGLERQGLQVVETDLGEYIVQLRGEAPSHIITPAVHLRRQDVGQLFHEKLGVPYTDEISTMTNVARQILREVFLNAGIGISGVNLSVADTGTMCLVTNEGNGRMVTTVPRVHIALMGIERLVPTMGDLALMLSLLPRSATGQKLSVYTSLLNSPRRQGDADGPEERHVILVDNGRRAVQVSSFKEILYCIRCGSCLNACPVFREIGGHAYVSRAGVGSPYPGPIGSVLSPALFGQQEYGHLARASSLCGACREACPVDIDLPRLLLRIRAGQQVQQAQHPVRSNAPLPLAIGLELYTLAASSPRRFSLAQRFAGFLGSLVATFHHGDSWFCLPRITGWGYSKDFPLPNGPSFRSRFLKRPIAAVQGGNRVMQPAKHSPEEARTNSTFTLPARSRIDIFASELQALGGNFYLCGVDEVPQKILQILHSHGIDHLLAWEPAHLPPGLLEKLEAEGIRYSHPSVESIDISSKVRAGLTGAAAGIADTGSLLLLGGRGKPLTASLLPEIHIALLREEDILSTLDDVFSKVDLAEAPAAVVITGPSRTADIEMTLTIGVHGPGELHVIIYRKTDIASQKCL